jgi:excisionase family DNA binding protein
MEKSFYSVEQISEMLSIHPKTIQRYIREGKLRASKIGKSWRVAGHDLSVFTERMENTKQNSDAIVPEDRIKISSVIDIDIYTRDEAERLINLLNAALNHKPPEYGRSTMHLQYIEPEHKLRLTLWGNAKFMEAMIGFISEMIKHFEEEL